MTDLTPTPKQLQYWIDKICYPHEQGVGPSLKDKELACLAFKAGADQELDACCEWFANEGYGTAPDRIRNHRRPKPPSVKEQGLESLDEVIKCLKVLVPDAPVDGIHIENIRQALETLPND
jgi:hypothetical protein